MSSPNPYNNYQSALQWAHNYNHNPNDPSKKDNSISIFWIVVVMLLLALAAWWWWSNHRTTDSSNGVAKESSPINGLKEGAKKSTTNGRLSVNPNGKVVGD